MLNDGDTLARWNTLYANLNGRPTAGVPGVRDTGFPCAFFAPEGGEDGIQILTVCRGDGHFLCWECTQFTPETDGDAP